MPGVLTHDTAQHLRAALNDALRRSPDVPEAAQAAFERLVDVLEKHADAVVFASEATLTTQQAAALIGVSRMTVVRLIDRGELSAEGGAVHRRIAVTELARYQRESARRRQAAIADLTADMDGPIPPDQVVETR